MDTVISNNIEEAIRTPPPRRSRRTRQSSSISGMFEDPMKTPSTPIPPASSTPSDDDDCDIQELARRLRRTKRSLLLKSAESPKSPVDRFRSIVLTLSTTPHSIVSPSSSLSPLPSHQQPSKE